MNLQEALAKSSIPDYMHGGLIRYIENRIRPGSFLTAVLTNDLQGAVAAADETNRDLIPHYIVFLFNWAPHESWGSPEKVKAWLAGGAL